MSPRFFTYYLIGTCLHITLISFWTFYILDHPKHPLFNSIGIILAAQMFFWIGYYVPYKKLHAKMEKEKLIQGMKSMRWIMFGWVYGSGLFSLFTLINCMVIKDYENLPAFTVTLGLSIGTYPNLRFIQRTLNAEQ